MEIRCFCFAAVFFKSEMSLIIYLEVLHHLKSPLFSTSLFLLLLASFRALLLLV